MGVPNQTLFQGNPQLDALISLSRAFEISIKDLMDNPAITESDDGM